MAANIGDELWNILIYNFNKRKTIIKMSSIHTHTLSLQTLHSLFSDHMASKKSEEFVKKLYVSKTKDPRRRRTPAVRCKDRVRLHMHEIDADRGGEIELTGKDCMDKEKWRLFCRSHPLDNRSRRERDVRDYRQKENVIHCWGSSLHE